MALMSAAPGILETTDEDVADVVVVAPTGGSLRDKLARRREELQRERTFEIDVPGYEQELAARYRPLGYREARAIAHRHEQKKDQSERELCGAADTLITACQTLIEKHPDGTQTDLDVGWGSAAARDLFGLELPDGVTTRGALLGIFQGNEMLLMAHFYEWASEAGGLDSEIDENLAGESTASN